MRSRNLNKRVELYTITAIPDGFGGSPTFTETLVSSLWCNVKTGNLGASFRSSNLEDIGTIDTQRAVLFTFRINPNHTITVKDHFIKYRGVKYTIKTSPINSDFDNRFISFVGYEG